MEIEEVIESVGFDCVGSCPTDGLQVREEVRDMCAAGRCQIYGHSWACPPNCGDLDYFDKFIHEKKTCYVVQTVCELEDDFDIETMMEAEEVLILATGAKKAQAVQHAIEGYVSHVWPITTLQHHPHGIIGCDKTATELLSQETVQYFSELEKNNFS